MNWSNFADSSKPAQIIDFEVVFSKVATVILGLAALTFFAMLIMGGFKYITSGGDPAQVESAQKTITTALMGFVLVALAYLIINAIAYITGAPITTFNISL